MNSLNKYSWQVILIFSNIQVKKQKSDNHLRSLSWLCPNLKSFASSPSNTNLTFIVIHFVYYFLVYHLHVYL